MFEAAIDVFNNPKRLAKPPVLERHFDKRPQVYSSEPWVPVRQKTRTFSSL
jgi:hypothetical protein